MTEIVRDGYERIADVFAEWRDRIEGDPRRDWRNDFAARLPDGARVLELGCGSGDDARELAQRFRVTGVDISSEQLRRASANVPDGEFIQADFTALDLPAAAFDAVASFYVFNHVPRDLLAPLLADIHRWLVRGGLLLAAFGVSDTDGWTGEWLGATMFFSSFPPETTTRLVRDAGFELLRDELVTFREPEGEATFQWVLARST
ncbi:MAG TPA: class I SAM-dependent methyltransferase [Gaiellaceae bacterium]|nr:class I SAM-dependent methyltransferase [Gaiellaceae bacterium]